MKFITESTSVNPAKKNQKINWESSGMQFTWESSGMQFTIGEKAITEQVIRAC
jgi:hypothetical protein